ncbi:MAG: AAA family ATPase, partial [Nitrososphaerales archaeon]
KLQTWEEFLSTTPEKREYTINGILPDSGLVVLLGRGKHGKSTLAVHACRAIGTGWDFLERQTKKKPIVYVNYEMAEDYLQTLLRAGDCPKGAFIINRPETILSLKTIGGLMAQVENGPGVMVIDSFRGAFKLQGDAENLAGGAGVILRQLQDLAIDKGWLVILIHHSNRGSKEGTDSVSGTSDWIAAPDVLWSWSRPDPDKSGTLIVEGRIPPLEPMAVKLTLEECNFVGTVKEDQEQTDKQEIIAALSEEGQTSEEIARAIGKPPGTTRTRLDSLYREDLVGREGTGRRGKPYKWIRIDSAQDNPLSAETKFEEPNEEKDKWQTLDL